MSPEALVYILIFVVVVFAIVWLALLVIERTFPAELQMPAKLVIGVIVLLALVLLLLRWLPGHWPGG